MKNTVLNVGCGEYGRYPLRQSDGLVYVDYFDPVKHIVSLIPANAPGETFLVVAGALYSAVGVSNAGNAWIFNQGSNSATKIPTDANGNSFTGNTDCAGYFYTYATVRNGQLWYWGSDDMKLFGGKAIAKPVQLTQPTGVTFVSVKMGNIILALSSTGDLWQYDGGNPTPHKVALPGAVTAYATSHTGFYLAIVNGVPYGWGAEGRYLGLTGSIANPVSLASTWGVGANITAITANHNTIHFIDANGNLFGMGDNAMGEVGNGIELVNQAVYPTPYAWSWNKYGLMVSKPVQIATGIVFTGIWAGQSYAFYHYAQDINGNVYVWGRAKSYVQGIDWTPSDQFPNAFDTLTPKKIDLFATPNKYMGTFAPGTVNAGPAQTLTTNTGTLSGTATPASTYTIVSSKWAQVTGATSAISSPGNITTQITGLTTGTYGYTLTTTDNNGGTNTSTTSISVSIPKPPKTIDELVIYYSDGTNETKP